MEWQDKARELYEQQGLSLRAIGKQLGVNYQRVSDELKKMGVKIKGARDGAKIQLHIDWDHVQRMYKDGFTLSECAHYAGCCSSYVGNKLRAMGTRMRSHGEARPASSIQVWLRSRGITQAEIARRAEVTQGTVSYHLQGRIRSQVVYQVFEEIGVPEHLLRKKVNKIEGKRSSKKSGGYWNPWAEGDIRPPFGVAANSILMNPLG